MLLGPKQEKSYLWIKKNQNQASSYVSLSVLTQKNHSLGNVCFGSQHF